jgi:hypothetical protein
LSRGHGQGGGSDSNVDGREGDGEKPEADNKNKEKPRDKKTANLSKKADTSGGDSDSDSEPVDNADDSCEPVSDIDSDPSGSGSNEGDNTSESVSDNEAITAVQIVAEYWGPLSGKRKYHQRIYDIELSDSTSVRVVGADRKKPKLDQDNNNFYSEVIRAWRVEHPEPPLPGS